MKRLEQLRRLAGMSQAELARQASLNSCTVSQAESGRFVPYPVEIARLAKALGWRDDPECLLAGVDDGHD
jgi:transcriptional regulator with XRE-family HTH domain